MERSWSSRTDVVMNRCESCDHCPILSWTEEVGRLCANMVMNRRNLGQKLSNMSKALNILNVFLSSLKYCIHLTELAKRNVFMNK